MSMMLRHCTDYDVIGSYFKTFSFILNNYINSIVTVFGIVGNFYVIHRLMRTKRWNTRFGRHVKYLCLWDCAVIVTIFFQQGPSYLIHGVMRTYGPVAVLIYFASPFVHMTLAAETFQTIALSIERLWFVSRPLHSRHTRLPSVGMISTIIALMTFIAYVPVHFYEFGINPCIEMNNNITTYEIGVRPKVELSERMKIAINVIPSLIFESPTPFIIISLIAVFTIKYARQAHKQSRCESVPAMYTYKQSDNNNDTNVSFRSKKHRLMYPQHAASLDRADSIMSCGDDSSIASDCRRESAPLSTYRHGSKTGFKTLLSPRARRERLVHQNSASSANSKKPQDRNNNKSKLQLAHTNSCVSGSVPLRNNHSYHVQMILLLLCAKNLLMNIVLLAKSIGNLMIDTTTLRGQDLYTYIQVVVFIDELRTAMALLHSATNWPLFGLWRNDVEPTTGKRRTSPPYKSPGVGGPGSEIGGMSIVSRQQSYTSARFALTEPELDILRSAWKQSDHTSFGQRLLLKICTQRQDIMETVFNCNDVDDFACSDVIRRQGMVISDFISTVLNEHLVAISPQKIRDLRHLLRKVGRVHHRAGVNLKAAEWRTLKQELTTQMECFVTNSEHQESNCRLMDRLTSQLSTDSNDGPPLTPTTVNGDTIVKDDRTRHLNSIVGKFASFLIAEMKNGCTQELGAREQTSAYRQKEMMSECASPRLGSLTPMSHVELAEIRGKTSTMV